MKCNTEIKKIDNIPLQSRVFGHRFRQDQTVYEYLLEFLIVAFSKKQGLEKDKYKYSKDDLFPIGLNKLHKITFNPTNNVALKRFIFFDKSKLENRYDIDKDAYDKHVELMKEHISIYSNDNDSMITEKNAVSILQNILYGFTAVVENRSWFAQSLLPICNSALTSEIMGKDVKGYNKLLPDEKDRKFYEKVDDHFETNRYNFMARGGEVYYLHLLNAINNNLEFKDSIENGFKGILNEFTEFETLCSRIQTIWDNDMNFDKDNGYESKNITKTLGSIPDGFKIREKNTLEELKNILETDMHPFEKIEILSVGLVFQLIIATHKQSKFEINDEESYMIFDVDCYKGKSNEEVKKISAENFNLYTQDILNALYSGYSRLKDDLNSEFSEEKIIKNAIDESIKVYKKLGKAIGIIRPVNEKYARFTLNEKILKFLVLALIKPESKITFDTFLDKLYKHFNIIIGKEELLKCDKRKNESMVSCLDINRNAMQIMLKECGFLRELSDSTSIVENPYMGVKNEKIY